METFILADADHNVRLMVREILSQLDQTVRLIPFGNASGLENYLFQFSIGQPLLVLLDPMVRFPAASIMIRSIKSNLQFASLPVLLWTRLPSPAFARLSAIAEVNGFYRKSDSASQSKRTIAEMLTLARTSSQTARKTVLH